MPLKAILFDLWDTLIYETKEMQLEWKKQRLAAFGEILQKWNSNISFGAIRNTYDQVHEKLKNKQRTELLVITPEKQVELILRSLNISLHTFPQNLRAKLLKAYISAALKPFPEILPEVKEVLKTTNDFGLKIALVSNTWSTPGVILRKILNGYEISKYFSFMLFSDEIGYPKPHKMIFNEALHHFPDSKPHEFIFIGDDYCSDIYGAKNVGMNTVWICEDDKEYHQRVSKALHYSDYRIISLAAVPAILADYLG